MSPDRVAERRGALPHAGSRRRGSPATGRSQAAGAEDGAGRQVNPHSPRARRGAQLPGSRLSPGAARRPLTAAPRAPRATAGSGGERRRRRSRAPPPAGAAAPPPPPAPIRDGPARPGPPLLPPPAPSAAPPRRRRHQSAGRRLQIKLGAPGPAPFPPQPRRCRARPRRLPRLPAAGGGGAGTAAARAPSPCPSLLPLPDSSGNCVSPLVTGRQPAGGANKQTRRASALPEITTAPRRSGSELAGAEGQGNKK